MADDNLDHEQEAEAAAGHEEHPAEESLVAHEELDGADPLEHDTAVSEEEIHAEEPVHTETLADQAPVPVDSTPPAVAPIADPGTIKHWYIIHAYSGFEQKVAES